MKILLIEDEPKVVNFLKQGLEEHLHSVTVAYDGFFGKNLATKNNYDIIILDLLIPYINGLVLCKQLRECGVTTPLLMLTALGTVDDKITGLEAGADDYLVKPFEFKELLARIKVLNKRGINLKTNKKLITVADLELDVESRIFKRSGKIIDLTAKEFMLLEYLVKNKNKVISRAEISENVWDVAVDIGSNIIDVYINFIRKKVDKDFEPKLIHTIVGMGYMFKHEEPA